MTASSWFGAAGELSRSQVLRKHGDCVLYRMRRDDTADDRGAVMAVLAAAEHPTSGSINRLTHEFGLKDYLDSAWAVRPRELVRERGRTVLLLDDPGGEPLDRLLGSPMELGQFLRIAIAMAGALRHLHERGLIHKDINPANVLVDGATGRVWLTGFGIASLLPRERQSPEPPEFIAGTLAYMAPEQTGRMNRSIDSRSDLYSLGVTLYEMLTGSLPFAAAEPMEWVHCHIARQPVMPAERMAAIPHPVLAIILKLLAKNAEDRYQTASGVEADLRTCAAQWQAGRRIEPFPLGARDASDRLLIPEKLYGREAEIESLLAAFKRVVADGQTELVLISGYAGIGKSSVVSELHKALVPSRGLFASGKFDQYKRDIPYATLAQAFQSLVRQLLGKSEPEVARWRQALLDALGPNGGLMVNLIPELALVIGEQPAVAELPPREGQNRFQRVFRRFLGVFARPDHPLALFLDDLQWLDTATLELLEHLATHPEVRYLLLVGAYRDNEVGPSHPLRRILTTIRGAGGRVHETILTPLASESVEQLIADSLHCDRATARPLAQLVHDKSEGNPFFAIQFFTALSDEDLLRFDHDRSAWAWDVSRIRAKGFTENVADLMTGKLTRLPDRTQRALGQLACLGNMASLATMALVHDAPETAIDEDLWEAVLAGLVFRADGGYRFLHDRVQEAAYALIPQGDRASTHLRIGQMLAAKTRAEEIEDAIFDIVNHLARGAELLTDPAERARAAALHLLAGRRAKSSTAYASARTYLAQATALLTADAWERRYEETFELYLLLTECEYLVGNFTIADGLVDTLLEQARTDIDRTKVHSLRIRLYQVAGKYDEGLAVALSALRQFGVTFPDSDDDIKSAIGMRLRDASGALGGRAIGDLLDAPVAADPVARAVIDLLVDATPCAYIARPPLFPLVTIEAVSRSIQYGNTDQSSYAYAVYALMLLSVTGDIGSAFEFSEMALRLNDRFNNVRLKGTLLHLHGDHINFWRRPFATGMPILEAAFTACLEVGDLVYAGFLAFETVWQVIEKGDPLEEVLALSAKYAAFAQQSHNDAVFETIRLEQRFVACLQGKTPDPLSFGDDTFDETACFNAVVKAAFGCGVVFFHIMKQMLAVLYGRPDEALAATARAEPVLGAAMAMPIEATYHFYHALAITALYRDAPAAQQQDFRRHLDEILGKLALWADSCPENYLNRHALVSAEIARLDGRDLEAMKLYEVAIRSARENGFVQNEGIASELAGRFCLELELEAAGRAYLRNARDCFAAWGAAGKVRQLDVLYPHLAALESRRSTEPMGSSVRQLDLATVVKASQALSGEIVLPKLIERLMTIALQNAGAERGLLILPHENDYRIEAEARANGKGVVLRHGAIDGAAVPETVIRYVVRTQNSVILDDAAKPNLFSEDAYLSVRRPRSILCVPLVRQGALSGLLYLENALASHVFTPERINLLELLASQAAISLENTRLYGDLQEREARVRRLVDSNIIGIFIFNLGGAIIDANDAFLRITGFDRDDLVAGRMRWRDLTPAEWQAVDEQRVADVTATGIAEPYEKEFFRKDGTRVPVLLGAAVFDGARDEGVAFVVDLTERRRAEEAARESERRYHEIQLALAHANRIAVMGQLSASIAHEVNQPLTGVITNADVALRWLAAPTPDPGEVRQALGRIVRDAKRASDVVGRLRALIKKAPPRKDDEVDVNEAIHEVISLTRSEIMKSGVAVETEFADDLPPIPADRVQLQQVMLNLIVNAIEAMSACDPGTRELHIRTARTGVGGVVVAVRDSGKGVGHTDLERIFDAFYSTKPDGLGMGLSICRAIIEAHGGRLWATTGLDDGAVFQFTLPEASADAA
ncbi:MAG TPA: AAA family ATPase [Candidatus Sulfotelmatobacter sp.]|nr:AAA family ATPase [Candidatus Sulfotelmatobacter sp.]